MSEPQYDRLKVLFIEARDLAGEARRSFVDGACGDDTALRDRLERLLDEHDRSGGVIASAGEGLGALQEDVAAAEMPQRIGDYAITGILGVGGMGVVYRAEQQNPHREVALKVLRFGALSPTLLRRFEHEVQVLGRLQHPGIAQIHEAGTFQEGRHAQPYFAMEYIHGRPLMAYVGSKDLGTRKRLELFEKICKAVQYAHHKGVIHRDLKPDNILVDDLGEPKILDFGIARATDADIQITTLRTDVGELIGTVPYMSPEQVTGDPHELDTRSDVYSLGVVLYELLCARLPHDLRNKTIPEAVRVIREEDPTPLSSVNRVFRGDLDTIVAKTLEKEKDRRYQSVAELAADVRRYLKDEPIVAHPPSRLYQIGKFARRHRGAVAGLAVAATVLVVATIVSSTLAVQSYRKSREVRVEADKLRSVNEFLKSMFEAVTPVRNRLELGTPTDVRVVDVIDYVAANLSSGYEGQPEVEAELRMVLSEALYLLGRREDAALQDEAAHALLERHLGARHPAAIRALVRLAEVYTGSGRLEEAERLARQALALCEGVFGPDAPDTIGCLNSLSGALFYQDRNDETLAVATDALARARRALPRDHDHRLAAMSTQAHVLRRLGRGGEAEPLLRAVLEIRLEKFGSKHGLSVLARRNLAYLLLRAGRSHEAIPMLRENLEINERNLGRLNIRTIEARRNLAVVLAIADDAEAAAPLHRENLEMLRQRFADEPEIRTANKTFSDVMRLTVGDLRDVLYSLGDHEEARGLAQEVLPSCVRDFGEDSEEVALAHHRLGRIYIALDRYEEAEAALEASLHIRVDNLGEGHASTREVRRDLVKLYEAWGRREDAARRGGRRAGDARPRSGQDTRAAVDRVRVVVSPRIHRSDP